MEPEQIKHAVRQLQMPQPVRARILCACSQQTETRKETSAMMYQKTRFSVQKPIAMLAAAAMCAVCAVGAVAAGRAGVFKNVTGWLGAVTGTRYEQAAAEITAGAAYADGALTVNVQFATPAEPPYSELETIAIAEYRILDSAGETVAAGGLTEAASVEDGIAKVKIFCILADGRYTLRIESFVGGSKADAPLPITGGWDCPFTV